MTRPSDLRTRTMSARTTTGAVLSIAGEFVGLVIQVVLIWLGLKPVLTPDDEFSVVYIVLWCLLAALYLGLVILGLNVMVWLEIPDPGFTRNFIGHPLIRLLSSILTFGTTALGIREAAELILNVNQPKVNLTIEITAIGTMLLAWAIFNWGYARIYYSRYHRASEPPLLFPGAREPRLTDFVYFSFTIATSFATSDVQVLSSRMRWTVMWHTSYAFFFNALIIALSMNVILRGDLFT